MKTLAFLICISLTALTYSQNMIEGFNTESVNVDTLLNKRTVGKNNKYSPDALTILFANTFNAALLGANDVVSSKYYATLTNEDNEFSFGYNFNLQKNKIQKASWLFSAGGTVKSKSGFATIYKNSKLQSDIRLNLKANSIGRGIIFFSEEDQGKSSKFYDSIVYVKYEKELTKYLGSGGELEKEVHRLKILEQDVSNEAIQKMIEKKSIELREKIAEEEVKAINDFHLYKYLWDHAWSFSTSLPISRSEYITSDTITSIDTTGHMHFPWSVNIQWTNVLKFKKQSTLYLTLRGKVYHNNNIATDEINSADFLSFVNQTATNQAVTNTNKVYVGEFRQFITPAFAAELIWYPYSSWVGLSGSVEQSVGDYNSLDWKLGLPVVLKDKEGKPTVNFELQWKEINKTHLIGLRFGFILGKFVN
ncbi:MAG: hypothetical protein HWE22_01045 [Flavobacteriales bacterium]|nr:hypothetical protein [Flavobacteriales bacterium]